MEVHENLQRTLDDLNLIPMILNDHAKYRKSNIWL